MNAKPLGVLLILMSLTAATRSDSPVADPPVIEPKAADAKIEILLSNGHHISVSGAYDPDALCRLVRGLR